MTDPTENLFSGLDRPRSLPPELRQRLEEQLLAATGAATEVPLGPELDERLRTQLVDPVAGALEGIDHPRPLDPALRRRLESRLLRRRRLARAYLGAAAVVVLVAAGVVLIVRPASPHRHPAPEAAAHPVTPSAVGAGVPAAPVPVGGGGVATGGKTLTTQGLSRAPGVTAGAPGTVFGTTADSLAEAARPVQGPLDGGTVLLLRGGNLRSTVAVLFGSARASYEVLSDSAVRAIAPAAAQAGTVDVVVELASGATYRFPAAFRYVATATGPRHPSAS